MSTSVMDRPCVTEPVDSRDLQSPQRRRERMRRDRSPRRRDARVPTSSFVVGMALAILSTLIVSAALYVTLISQVTFGRSQKIAFDEFRLAMARGTAPVAQAFVEEPRVDPMAIPTVDPAERGAKKTVPDPAEEKDTVPRPRPALYRGGTPIAVMTVPALGIENLVVVEGTQSVDTQIGPGHLRQSRFPGQAGVSTIFGRRWSFGAPFRDIAVLAPGDKLEMTTGQGSHVYSIVGSRHGGDPLPSRAQGEGWLELVTAEGTPFAPERTVYIDAKLVSTTVDGKTNAEPQPSSGVRPVPAELHATELTGDPSGWLPLMLWLQGLVLASFFVVWSWRRWGTRQTWLAGMPVLIACGLGVSSAIAQLLPNLL